MRNGLTKGILDNMKSRVTFRFVFLVFLIYSCGGGEKEGTNNDSTIPAPDSGNIGVIFDDPNSPPDIQIDPLNPLPIDQPIVTLYEIREGLKSFDYKFIGGEVISGYLDASGNGYKKIEYVESDGRTVTVNYDSNGLMSLVDLGDGSNVTYVYDDQVIVGAVLTDIASMSYPFSFDGENFNQLTTLEQPATARMNSPVFQVSTERETPLETCRRVNFECVIYESLNENIVNPITCGIGSALTGGIGTALCVGIYASAKICSFRPDCDELDQDDLISTPEPEPESEEPVPENEYVRVSLTYEAGFAEDIAEYASTAKDWDGMSGAAVVGTAFWGTDELFGITGNPFIGCVILGYSFVRLKATLEGPWTESDESSTETVPGEQLCGNSCSMGIATDSECTQFGSVPRYTRVHRDCRSDSCFRIRIPANTNP